MYSSVILATMVAGAIAKTIIINAGQNGLTYSPSSTTADVGDVVEFHFFGSFHTAVQGDFSTPCQRGSLENSGFSSGMINNKPDGSGSVFQVTIQNTDPMWYYCGTPSHCQAGMVGVINPPSSGNSLDTYKSNAAETSSSELPSTVEGGVVVPVPAAAGSSSSSSVPSAPPATSSPPVSVAPSSAPASSAPEASPTAAPSTTSSQAEVSTSSGAAATSQSSTPASQPASTSGSVTSKTTSTPAVVTTSGGTVMITKGTTLMSAMVGLGFLFALMV